MAVLKGWLEGLAVRSFELNQKNIIELIGSGPYACICDLGCDDGAWTMELARTAGATEIHGVEIVEERAALARKRGVEVALANLNERLPFRDAMFDLVHANQVIEHIGELDTFLGEIERVLKPSGVCIISTENGSSWHNVAAAALGWQIFSLTNVSPWVGGIGNPFALHRGEQGNGPALTHKTIFNYRGLLELLDAYGLRPVAVRGAGYHPLPPSAGRLDARHAHILAVKATKSGMSTRPRD